MRDVSAAAVLVDCALLFASAFGRRPRQHPLLAAHANQQIEPDSLEVASTLLWETSFPAAGNATPSIHSINGKEDVVIACGGGKNGAPSGSSIVAFTLSETAPRRRVSRVEGFATNEVFHDPSRAVRFAPGPGCNETRRR